MASDNFFILTVDGLTPLESDIFTSVAFDNGACGVTEDLPFSQTGETYEPVPLPHDLISLKVYFESPPSAKWIEELKIKYGCAQFTLQVEQQKDWLEEWKKGYEAFPLNDEQTIWVVPSWRPIPAQAERVIRIDPGMAFGTGTHETTKLAARFLIQEQKRFAHCKSGLDIGTGTGILAMLMAQLGLAHVVGVDIDSVARQVARENARLNGLADVTIAEEQIGELSGKFDVVVANIVDGVLLKIQREIVDHVCPSGHLFLTGILQERAGHFLQNFDSRGFIFIKQCQMGEWVGVYFVRDTE